MNSSTNLVREVGIGTGKVHDRGKDRRFTEYEPRRRETFICPSGHTFTKDFYAHLTEVPSEWACVQCSAFAQRVGAEVTSREPAPLDANAPVRPGCWYTAKHRKDVFERRTENELCALVEERLTQVFGADR